jgi:hypothetical protein
MTDTEHTAWLWLMALPRVEPPKDATGPQIREITDRQIKIMACPGKLHTNCGAPLIYISILLPNFKRVKGSGNSLYGACDRAQSEAWRAGVELPFLSVFHIERVRRGDVT